MKCVLSDCDLGLYLRVSQPTTAAGVLLILACDESLKGRLLFDTDGRMKQL